MESFFHTLKTELVHHRHYETRTEAKRDIFAYIEGFYNRTRRHSAIGHISPIKMELKAAEPERLRDAPAEWSRQFEKLGLNPRYAIVTDRARNGAFWPPKTPNIPGLANDIDRQRPRRRERNFWTKRNRTSDYSEIKISMKFRSVNLSCD
jgi:hypothetical protein